VRILPAGDAAVLVELADLAEAGRLYASLRADPPPGTLDLVPATRTVLVTLDRAVTGPEQVAAVLRSRSLAAGPDPGRGELVELPTRYDGPDLADVAALTGLTGAEVVRRHAGREWTVAFCGFAPGFAYIAGLPQPLRLPRLDQPRTAVPAGAVAIAEEYTGIYPRESPGGWRPQARCRCRPP